MALLRGKLRQALHGGWRRRVFARRRRGGDPVVLRRAILLACSIAVIARPVVGRDIYVATNALPSADYNNWANAFNSVQDALDYAQPGDTIYLAGHTFALDAALDWSAMANVTIRGGYAATNAVDQPGPFDPGTWETVLTRELTATNRIMTLSGVTNGTLQRLTLAGGYVVDESGGGLSITDCPGLSIRDCIIRDNRADRPSGSSLLAGGGLWITGTSSVVISNTWIMANDLIGSRYTPVHGGGVYAGAGTTVGLIDSILERNRAYLNNISASQYAFGGGAYNSGTMTLDNVLVVKNEARHNTTTTAHARGSGLYNAGGSLTLINATLAHAYGEAITRQAGTVEALNCIFWRNSIDLAGAVVLTDCLTNTNPEFVVGYYLATNSPAVDAGSGASRLLDSAYTTRADGDPDTGAVDLGYHFTTSAHTNVPSLFVSPDGDDANAGTSWATARRTLGAALATAWHDTTVFLAAGAYTNGAETFPLQVDAVNNVRICGSNSLTTLINADGQDRVMHVHHAPGFTLAGITLRDGAVDGHGAGLWIDYSPWVTVSNVVVSNNATSGGSNGASRKGGGIYLDRYSDHAMIVESLFRDNYAGNGANAGGGAVFVSANLQTEIQQCVFRDNSTRSSWSGARGGAIENQGDLTVRNSVLHGNWSRFGSLPGNPNYEDGYAIYTSVGTLTLENCTIVDNKEDDRVGSAVYQDGGALIMRNCILRDHNSRDIDRTFGAGTISLSYCTIEDGTGVGENGNLSVDPIFADPDTHDYRLQSAFGRYNQSGQSVVDTQTSPCIDGGTNLAWMTDAVDLDDRDRISKGLPRSGVDQVDMGAYEVRIPDDRIIVLAPGVTDVTATHVVLGGELLHAGAGDAADVIVAWAQADAGTNSLAAWSNQCTAGTQPVQQPFGCAVSNLAAGSSYVYRCYASNGFGIGWSTPHEFVIPDPPAISNLGAAWIRRHEAAVSGEIISTGNQDPMVWLDYWSGTGSVTSRVPLGVLGEGPVLAHLTNLTANTVYTFRFSASNAADQVNSATRTVKTLSAGPIDWYVAEQGDGTGGTSWNSAFNTLPDALAVTESGDTIYLAGQVFELTDVVTIDGMDDIRLVGGYAATNSAALPGIRDPDQWPTVLTRSATATNRLMTITASSRIQLVGLTLTGGLTQYEDGAGVLIVDSPEIRIEDCVIRDNQANYPTGSGALSGGGLRLSGTAEVTISNTLVTANSVVTDRYVSPRGGGVAVGAAASLTAIDSVFSHNLSRNPSISANQPALGGAIYSDGSLTLRNCLLIKNETRHAATTANYERGAGVYVAGGTSTLVNCTLAHNFGHGVYRSGGDVFLTNCIAWWNTLPVAGAVSTHYSNIEDGSIGGGNLASDPLFEYGYYLGADSPSINTGLGADRLVDGDYTTRADGTPDTGTVDMGYHERQAFDLTWTNLYVAPSGHDGWDGLTPATAKRTVGAALALARHGSRIYLAAGDYTTSNEVFPLTVVDLNDVHVIGEHRDNTVLDAGQTDRVLTVMDAPGFRLADMTLTGGKVDGHGGGLWLSYSPANVRIDRCRFHANQTDGSGRQGGGAYLGLGVDAWMTDSLVVSNYAGTGYGAGGGGVYLGRGSSLRVSRSLILFNYATSSHSGLWGGGVRNAGGTLAMFNCVLAGNWLRYASGNTTYENGHGLHSQSAGSAFPASASLDNCTVVANRRDSAVGVPVLGVMRASGDMILRNCIVWDHNGKDVTDIGVTILHSNIEDGTGVGTNGNLSLDPLFLNAGRPDYRLQSQYGRRNSNGQWVHDPATSPGIDAGTNMSWMAAATDLDGRARIARGIFQNRIRRADMGAYENHPRPRGTVLITR